MIHNYYLYEENGQLTMLPWDYNLAYGTFQSGNGQSTINTPIDTPVSGGSSDRPMLNWIFESEEYTEMYHQYFAEFLNTVNIQGIIDNAYNLIKSYVEKDPTAFYSYDEFEVGVETLRQFCALRSESISMQLENDETTTNMSYVDASGLTLSDMGSMGGMGGFGGGDKPDMSDRGNSGDRNSSDKSDFEKIPSTDNGILDDSKIQNASASGSGMNIISTSSIEMLAGFDMSQIPGGMSGQMPNMGEIPEGFDPSQIPGGMSGQMPNMGEIPEGFDPSQIPGSFPGQSSGGNETTSAQNPADTGKSDNSNRPSSGNMMNPGGDFNINMSGIGTSPSGWVWIVVSVIVLGVGLLIAKKYKY